MIKIQNICGFVSLLFYATLIISLQGCLPNENVSLSVPLHYQETDYWCWAACAQMIMDYNDHNISQCKQANDLFGRSDCCAIDLCSSPLQLSQNNQLKNCVCGGWPEFDRYGFTYKKTSGKPLKWKQIKEQISSYSESGSSPFAFTWNWSGGGAHMMVVKGFIIQDGKKFVIILDPLPLCMGGENIITYKYFKSELFHHSHSDDYYDITFIGGN
jgi:hypothetical protein